MDLCASCNVALDTSHGERFCPSCGLVVEDRLIEGVHQSVTVLSASLSMTHATVPGRSSSTFGPRYRDSNGSPVRDAREVTRLRWVDRRAHLRSEYAWARTGPRYRAEATRIADVLGIPFSFLPRVEFVLREARDHGLLRGRSCGAVLGAVFIHVARESGIVLSTRDAAARIGVPWPALGAAYRKLVRGLRIALPPPTIELWLRKVAIELDVPSSQRDLTIRYARDHAESLGAANPAGIASALAYKLWKPPDARPSYTQHEIATRFCVTEATVRNNVDRMFPRMFPRGAKPRTVSHRLSPVAAVPVVR